MRGSCTEGSVGALGGNSQGDPDEFGRNANMFVTHLESAIDGTRFEPGQVLTVHKDRPLWVRYDLAAVRKAVKREAFAQREASLWRYRELLPLPAGAERVAFGESMTPILPCPRLGKELGFSRLYIKDE